MPTTKSTSSKTASKSTTTKSASKSIKPGMEAEKNMTLYVKDSKGKTISEIVVPAGNKVPPTRSKNATSYSTKK